MHCLDEETLLRLAAGVIPSREQAAMLHHVEHCERCRREYEVASRAVRIGFPALARASGWRPEPESDRVEQILEATARRSPSEVRVGRRPRTARRRLVRIAIAAVALLLVVGTARYLGEPGRMGRLETVRGAILRSTDGGPLLPSPATGTELAPGDRLIAMPDSMVVVRIGDRGRLVLHGPGLIALGTADGPTQAFLARGVADLDREEGTPLAIRAGGRRVLIDGSAEIAVRANDRLAVFDAARAQAEAFRDRGWFERTFAATPEPDGASVHVTRGKVLLPGDGGTEIDAGYESFVNAADVSPARFEGLAPLYAPRLLTTLTADEVALLPGLLPEDEDAVHALLRAAASIDEPAPGQTDERALALWLLAQIGDRSVLPEVRRIFREGPPALRAPAAHTLALLGDLVTVNAKALSELTAGDPPAIAEALVQALGRSSEDGIATGLAEFAARSDRPAFARALAAHEARARGAAVDVGILTSIAASHLGGEQVLDLVGLELVGSDEGRGALLRAARTPGHPLRTIAFDRLAKAAVPGVEDAAEEILRAPNGAGIAQAALEYLAQTAPGRAMPHIERLVSSDDRQELLAGLRAYRLCPSTPADAAAKSPRIQERIRELVHRSDTPVEVLMLAFWCYEGEDGAALLAGLISREDPELRKLALKRLSSSWITGRKRPDGASFERDLLARLDDDDPETRQFALGILAAHRPSRALDEVERRLSAYLPDRADDPLAALERLPLPDLGTRDLDRAANLLADVASDGKERWIRVLATDTMKRLLLAGSTAAHRRLLEILRGPDVDLRAAAAGALARDPDLARLGSVIPELFDGPALVARAAAGALLARYDSAPPGEVAAALLSRSDVPLVSAVRAVLTEDAVALARVFANGSESDVALLLLCLPAGALGRLAPVALPRVDGASRELRILLLARICAALRALDGRDREEALDGLAAALSSIRTEAPFESFARELEAAGAGDLRAGLARTVRAGPAGGALRALAGEPGVRSFSDHATGRVVLRWATERKRSHSFEHRNRETRDALLAELESPNVGTRELAIRGFGEYATRAEVALLADLLGAEQPEFIRRRAHETLVQILGLNLDAKREGWDPGRWLDWWSDRAFALDIPVVSRQGRSTR